MDKEKQLRRMERRSRESKKERRKSRKSKRCSTKNKKHISKQYPKRRKSGSCKKITKPRSPKRRKKSARKNKNILSRFARGEDGAEEKKEEFLDIKTPEEKYLEFYRRLPFEETIRDNNSAVFIHEQQFRELYNSENLSIILDLESYSNIFRDIFYDCLSGFKEIVFCLFSFNFFICI